MPLSCLHTRKTFCSSFAIIWSGNPVGQQKRLALLVHKFILFGLLPCRHDQKDVCYFSWQAHIHAVMDQYIWFVYTFLNSVGCPGAMQVCLWLLIGGGTAYITVHLDEVSRFVLNPLVYVFFTVIVSECGSYHSFPEMMRVWFLQVLRERSENELYCTLPGKGGRRIDRCCTFLYPVFQGPNLSVSRTSQASLRRSE